jgi:hypothetical protein
MRSTNLVIFLVLLNAAAGIAAVGLGLDVTASTGADGVIQTASDDLENREVNRPASDELIGSFFGVGALIQDIRLIIFYGPEMLRGLGAPDIIIDGLQGVIAFVVVFDVAEAISGRILS